MDEKPLYTKVYGTIKSFVMIILGIIFLFVGGRILVYGAVRVAQFFGISESIIGLTIVASGTSLPELITSILASYRKSSDIAVGNVIGSNIFNIFFILGISAIIKPLAFNEESMADILMTILATSLFIFAAIIGKKRRCVDRAEGLVLIAIYVLYVVFLVIREIAK